VAATAVLLSCDQIGIGVAYLIGGVVIRNYFILEEYLFGLTVAR